MPVEKYLTRKEAAEYCRARGLPIAPTTLAKFVSEGGGPPYYRFGRAAVYWPADLDAWITERLGQPRRTTTELEAA